MVFCQHRVIFLPPFWIFFLHPTNSIVNMTHIRRNAAKLTSGLVFALLLCISGSLFAQNAKNGEALYKANCTACHAMDKKLTGPALQGAAERWNDDKMLHNWIYNNQKVLASNYKYATDLYKAYGSAMTVFEGNLKPSDVDDIIAFIKGWTPPVATKNIGDPNAPTETDNTLLFGILTLILAVITFVLLQVNSNLKKLADDKDGIPAEEPVSFWKNKAYIAFAVVVLFLVGGYYLAQGAIGLGRTQKYQPQQPIFYSHKVHAGVNQINCMYCHIGTYQGKQATLPSVNVCMNCHMAINEYKGTAKLYTAEGEEVNGSAEIQKLYSYAGYTPGQPWDASKATPIKWVRIHNLPDHVYFNHSQHVVAGKVQCQTCHGEITKMDEVYQFAPLSMGWCVNCHRTTAVQFKDNGFYSIYEKFHDEIKNHTRDSVTVENIGGTDCQKCHY